MTGPRKLVGEAMLGIRFARSLYARWSAMRAGERERLSEMAERVKDNALDLRGAGDRDAAERDLHEANKQLAAAMVESAEADPELDEIEVRRLREDLRRELDRLATAEIEVTRAKGVNRPVDGG